MSRGFLLKFLGGGDCEYERLMRKTSRDFTKRADYGKIILNTYGVGEWMAGLMRRVRTYIEHHGAAYTLRRAAEKTAEQAFGFYDRAWRKAAPSEAELQRQQETPVDAGLITVVVPVYNTDPGMLREMAASLLAQTYPQWEAILYDDCSTKTETLQTLERIGEQDRRLRVYHGEKNQGISGSSNSAAALARGEWITLLDHDDLLTPDALYRVAETIVTQQPDMIYSDEDKITENGMRHTDPHFKPDFCPDNLRSGNYFCHLMVMRKSLIEQAGGFRTAFNGSQDHDLALRCIEHTDKIVHIPRILYHWRTVGGSVSHQNLMRCVNAACAAVQEHMERIGWPGTAEAQGGNIRLKYRIKGQPSVGVYVFGEKEANVEKCARRMDGMAWPALKVHKVCLNGKSRYAAMNRAAETADEDVLLMLDASVMPAGPDFVKEMLMYAQRDDVGAVTPEISFRHGLKSFSGYEMTLKGQAPYREAGLSERTGGLHFQRFKSHNVAAVSAACLMVRRDHWIPLDESYAGPLGAVDWSFRLGAMNMRHVFTPHARAVCGQGALLTTEKSCAADRKRFYAQWQDGADF